LSLEEISRGLANETVTRRRALVVLAASVVGALIPFARVEAQADALGGGTLARATRTVVGSWCAAVRDPARPGAAVGRGTGAATTAAGTIRK
jgi:hypothetical protein